MLRIPLESHIEQSLIGFKPRLGKWVLVNFEGTSLNVSMIFPLLLKFPLTFMNMGIWIYIICISNHKIKLLCPGINLVPS